MTRRRWTAFAGLVVAVVGVVALLVTNHSPDIVDARGPDDAPGFRQEERDVDRSPFELAEPTTTAGPTTVPRARGLGTRRTTTTTSTTTTTTTTTTLPTSPIIPPRSSITSVCGLVLSFESLNVVFSDPDVDAERALGAFLSNLDRYIEISPPEIRADIVAARDQIAGLTDQLRALDWDPTRPEIRRAVQAISTESPPFETLQEHLRRVEFYEGATCPA